MAPPIISRVTTALKPRFSAENHGCAELLKKGDPLIARDRATGRPRAIVAQIYEPNPTGIVLGTLNQACKRYGLSTRSVSMNIPVLTTPIEGTTFPHQGLVVCEENVEYFVGLSKPMDEVLGVYPYTRASSFPLARFAKQNMVEPEFMMDSVCWDISNAAEMTNTHPLIIRGIEEGIIGLVELGFLLENEVLCVGLTSYVLRFNRRKPAFEILNGAAVFTYLPLEVLRDLAEAAAALQYGFSPMAAFIGMFADKYEITAGEVETDFEITRFEANVQSLLESAWPTIFQFLGRLPVEELTVPTVS